MIAIAIMAIMTVMAAPSLTTLFVNNTIAAASSDLSTDIILARSEALRINAPVSICPSTDGATCGGSDWTTGWIVTFNNGGGDTVVKTHPAIAAGYTLTVAPSSNAVFTGSGYPDAARTWTTCKSGYSGRLITMNSSGSLSSTSATCS